MAVDTELQERPLLDTGGSYDSVIPYHRFEGKNLKPNTNLWYRLVKRTMDVVCSALALIVLSPLLIVTAIVIKCDGGPAFYRQTRIGRDGAAFSMYKFRSMVVDADQLLKTLWNQNEASGPVFKMENDPRVTRFGKFIRKYSIDELPQLLNILKGEMSIVGPRPALPAEVERYTDYDRMRLMVKPGLTCYWQCGGRSKVSFEKWVDMDLEYIRDQGIWRDIWIIIKTVPAVFRGNGAY